MTKQQNLVRENKGLGKEMQKAVKEEKGRLEKVVKSQEQGGEVGVRRTQLDSVTRRFLEIWTEYNDTQMGFRESNKKALIRNLRIVDPKCSVTNEELEDKLEAGDFSVLSSIIKETDQAKEELQQLEGRHLEIVKLEKGVMEVRTIL